MGRITLAEGSGAADRVRLLQRKQEEVHVFQIAEDAQVQDQAHGQEAGAFALVRRGESIPSEEESRMVVPKTSSASHLFQLA